MGKLKISNFQLLLEEIVFHCLQLGLYANRQVEINTRVLVLKFKSHAINIEQKANAND